MYLFDLRIGRFAILAEKAPDYRLGIRPETLGDIVMDIPYVRWTFSGFRKAIVQQGIG
jgi:hypothetical protein